jgi:hypothetical protein
MDCTPFAIVEMTEGRKLIEQSFKGKAKEPWMNPRDFWVLRQAKIIIKPTFYLNGHFGFRVAFELL